MKVITYRRPEDGGTSVCVPAPWARYCSAVTFKGERIELDPPVPFDTQARVYGASNLVPEWSETEEDFVARIQKKDVPKDAEEVRIIEADDLPTDRTFRNALEPDLTVNMTKARDIWKDAMRDARKPLLLDLDVQYMLADEVGDSEAKAAIAAKKQALRDITLDQGINKASTPDELKAVWPDILKA